MIHVSVPMMIAAELFTRLKRNRRKLHQTLTGKELEKVMNEADSFRFHLHCGKAANHPQLKAGDVGRVEDPVLGKIKSWNPIKMHSTPGSVEHSAPTLGQHNEEILSKLGYSEETIRNMAENGVI